MMKGGSGSHFRLTWTNCAFSAWAYEYLANGGRRSSGLRSVTGRAIWVRLMKMTRASLRV